MKNLSLKLFVVLFVSLLWYSLQAQQTIPYGTPGTYSVDLADGPTGTSGSNYVWTVFDSGTPPTDITTGLVITGQGTNEITIAWGTTPPGVYTLQVVETNGLCPSGPPVIGTVTITALGDPDLDALDTNICAGDVAQFEIAGAPANSQVVFTVTGGTPNVTSPVTTDASGNATIIVTHDGTSPQIDVTITDMILADGTPSDFADQTESTTVTIVTTSAINFTP